MLWSPDSKKIATQQQDERKVGEMYRRDEGRASDAQSVEVSAAWRLGRAMLHRVIIDVASGSIVRLQLPPEFHRATTGDNISMNDYN